MIHAVNDSFKLYPLNKFIPFQTLFKVYSRSLCWGFAFSQLVFDHIPFNYLLYCSKRVGESMGTDDELCIFSLLRDSSAVINFLVQNLPWFETLNQSQECVYIRRQIITYEYIDFQYQLQNYSVLTFVKTFKCIY